MSFAGNEGGALYAGAEKYAFFQPYFEKFCQRNLDGCMWIGVVPYPMDT